MYVVAYRPHEPDQVAAHATIVIRDDDDLFWHWLDETVFVYEFAIFEMLEEGCWVALLPSLPETVQQMIDAGQAILLESPAP